jgi:hypothetical protein
MAANCVEVLPAGLDADLKLHKLMRLKNLRDDFKQAAAAAIEAEENATAEEFWANASYLEENRRVFI